MTSLLIILTVGEWLGALPVGVQVAMWTAIGAIGLKVAEKYLNKHAETLSDRKDYRDEIKELRDRVDKLEVDVESWRTKYYKEQEEVSNLKRQLYDSGTIPRPNI